jgi:hypothetical protein
MSAAGLVGGTVAVEGPRRTDPRRHKQVEAGLRNLRENRHDSATWLALEVLLTDPFVITDQDLANKLHELQDRLEERTREKYQV